MLRCYPGAVGLPIAISGWVAMLVAVTSKLLGLMVVLCDISYLVINQGMMGKWVY